jgi:hypothetical protein
VDIFSIVLGNNYRDYYFLFPKGIFKKGAKMRKKLSLLIIIPFFCAVLAGCVPLIVGAAAGALGAVAISKDTIQGETDKPYESLWNSALLIARIRGTIKQEDSTRGYLELEADSSTVYINLVRMTQAATRLKVASRKHHLPNMKLAEDIFVKIMEQVK